MTHPRFRGEWKRRPSMPTRPGDKPSTVYAVGWDEPTRMVKFGVSKLGRWRSFQGGHVLALVEFDRPLDAYLFERALHIECRRSLPAFISKEEAAPFLGQKGTGYCECYLMSGVEGLMILQSALAEHCDAGIVTVHRDDAMRRTMRVTGARTYGRDVLTKTGQLFANRWVGGFSSDDDHL